MDVREIGADELQELVDVVLDVDPGEPVSVEVFVDWARQTQATTWALACVDGRPVGAGVALVGWHMPAGTGRAEIWVREEHRRRGVGTALLTHLARWLAAHGARDVDAPVREDDPASLAWAERRGFRERGRNSRLVLHLDDHEPAPIAPPEGITVRPWSDCAGIERALYAVYCEAEPDIPGEEDNDLASFEQWLEHDMGGVADRRDATFVAFAGDDVVGYAKLSLPPTGGDVAFHDLAAVLRAWRRRGIAGALKRAQIAWAKEHGFRRLVTGSEERNEPSQALNRRHGYVREPGTILLNAPLDAVLTS